MTTPVAVVAPVHTRRTLRDALREGTLSGPAIVAVCGDDEDLWLEVTREAGAGYPPTFVWHSIAQSKWALAERARGLAYGPPARHRPLA